MKGINATVGVANMIPFSVMKDPKKKFEIRHMYGADIPQYKEVEQAAEFIGCEVDDLYLVNNSFYPYCYFKDLLYIDLMNMGVEVLEFIQVRDRVRVGHEQIEEFIEKKEFQSLFALMIDKKISFYAYNQLYDQIPDDQKYDVFKDIYTHNEYGFRYLDKERVRDVFNHRTEKYKRDVLNRISKLAIDGKVTIYRGEASESTNYPDAYSWTTSLGTAIFFATRYSSEGEIYSTDVSVSDVIDFYEGRGESEVIVLPEHIDLVYKVDYLSTKRVFSEFKRSGYLSRFNLFSKRLEPELFHNPNGIHAVGHCRRVLFHAMNLCRVLVLPFDEERILASAASYHDIGRTHDNEDERHGYAGYKKMLSLGLGRMDTADSQEILHYLIDNHCIRDVKAYANVADYAIKDKDRAVYLLKVFKDADGLDRVRIRDLDPNYLRMQESQLFVSFADDLLQQMP